VNKLFTCGVSRFLIFNLCRDLRVFVWRRQKRWKFAVFEGRLLKIDNAAIYRSVRLTHRLCHIWGGWCWSPDQNLKSPQNFSGVVCGMCSVRRSARSYLNGPSTANKPMVGCVMQRVTMGGQQNFSVQSISLLDAEWERELKSVWVHDACKHYNNKPTCKNVRVWDDFRVMFTYTAAQLAP